MHNLLSSRNRFLQQLLPWLVLSVFILPILIYWIDFHWIRQISPYFEWYDPEFAYLMNSLEVFKGHAYQYLDHPGTPVEVIGTIIFALIYPFLHKSPSDFIVYNLLNPGLFLYLAHGFLAVANIACVIVFFFVATPIKRLGTILAGSSLAMLYFVIHPMTFFATSTWAHNSFAFPFGTLLLLYLYSSLTRESADRVRSRHLIALGFGSGVLAAVTVYITSWPIGVLSAVVLYGYLRGETWNAVLRDAGTVGISSLLGFAVALMPALPNTGAFFEFLGEFLQSGNQPGLSQIISNVSRLGQQAPVLLISAVVLLVLIFIAFLIWRKEAYMQPGLWGLAGGLTIQFVVLLAALLNRYTLIYFLAPAAIVPVLALIVLRLYARHATLRSLLTSSLVLLVIIGLPISLKSQMMSHQGRARYIASVVQQESVLIQQDVEEVQTKPSPVIVYSYGTFAPCASLWHGNVFTGQAFNQELMEICTNQYFYFRELGNLQQDQVYSVRTPLGPRDAATVHWDIFVGCKGFTNYPILANTDAVIHPTSAVLICPWSKTEPLIVAYRK